METAMLQQTAGRLGRLWIPAVLLLFAWGPGGATPLFEDDTIIDVSLSGPLGTISREREDEERVEYPFVLTVDGRELPVMVRVRGKSRTVVCEFPPLRLNFDATETDDTPFSGQDTLKMVTHCESGKDHYEINVVDEYLAYRIFNVISEAGFRVRLLRVTYEDTSGRLKDLERPYYAFVVEPDDDLAARLEGTIASIEAVLYSRLDESQTALMNVFQYLIANTDWSFVRNLEDEDCCHNVDLIEKNEVLLPVPRDFDLAGLVNATYAKPAEETRIRRVTTRAYRGYCRSPIDAVASALDRIVELQDEIMAVVAEAPDVEGDDKESRAEYIGEFFEEATEDREKLLKQFEKKCIG